MRRIKLLTVTILVLALMCGVNTSVYADSCGGFAEKDVYTPAENEVIKDPVLHWAVRSALNRIEDRPLLTEELVGQISGVSFEACAHPDEFVDWEKPFWIENLEGLQYAKKATMIDICYVGSVDKRINSLAPISDLTKLTTLWLKQDGITDISPLRKLVNIDHLELSSNEITDISAIADMSKLTHLIVEYNMLTDVDAIENLTNLEYVNIANNSIASLPDMSQLSNLHYFDASGNNLTNADVARLQKCINIEELNLNRNDGITNVKPLARLINLDPVRTSIPVSADTKADLFAAIDVNKLIDQFNISRMQESDIEYVQEALDAYEALTGEQKTYFDSDRIAAIRNNLNLVMNGSEPVYYEEYDEGGGSHPVWDRVIVKAVDNHGNPLEGISFVKKSVGTNTYTTDSKGMVVIPHASWDMAWDLSVYIDPSETGYVCVPEKYEYEVNGEGKTYIINGKWATGFEEFTFVLTPVDEYVDKTVLEAAIDAASEVREAFRYTDASYRTYEDALAAAKEIASAGAASQNEIDDAAEALNDAIEGLVMKDKLTALKITVRDENGNLFARPFQVQAFAKSEGYKSYNDFTDPETGAVIFPALDTWTEGTEWAFQCCWREPYQFTCSNVPCTIGVEDGVPYFKTVDGKAVDADFELEVTVTPDTTNTRAIRVALSDYLRKVIGEASEYDESMYTVKSYGVLADAIDAGAEVADRIDAAREAGGEFKAQAEIELQEEANAAVKAIWDAEAGLERRANTVALYKLVNMASGYSKKMYTSASWATYETVLSAARAVLEDDDASQSEVDTAADHLRAAQSGLVLLADKTELKKLLDRAEAINPEDYESGIPELNEAVSAAQEVYDNPEATKPEAEAQVEALNTALNNLIAKKPEVSYDCYESVFRALVTDEMGKPVAGVHFQQIIDGKVATDSEPIVSNSDGVIQYYIWTENIGKTTEVKVADDKYMSSDVHTFKASGAGIWSYRMTEIDGKPYAEGTKLKYVVKANDGTGGETSGGEEPEQPGGEDPDQPGPGTEVSKSALEEQINIADSMRNKSSDYTKASFDAMLEALKSAQAVFAKADATQDEVNAAASALKSAREGLVKAEKPVVCEQTAIRILLVDAEGERITAEVPYTMSIFGSNLKRTAKNGVIEYELSDGDSGVPSIRIALDSDTLEIGGAEYTADVTEHVFSLNSSSLGVTITAIDGKSFSGTQEVKFVFSRKEPEVEPGGDVDTSELRKQIDELKAELDNVKGELADAKTDAEEAQKTIKALQDRIAELEERLKAAEGSQSATDSRIDELEKLIEQMQKELEETRKELEESRKEPEKPAPVVTKPKTTSITKLTAGKKYFKATWAKRTCTGYQIRYSGKKSMSGAKVLTVKTNTRTVKKLKAKKRYYVQVRTYKTVSGKKYYSAWSAKKSVRVK